MDPWVCVGVWWRREIWEKNSWRQSLSRALAYIFHTYSNARHFQKQVWDVLLYLSVLDRLSLHRWLVLLKYSVSLFFPFLSFSEWWRCIIWSFNEARLVCSAVTCCGTLVFSDLFGAVSFCFWETYNCRVEKYFSLEVCQDSAFTSRHLWKSFCGDV